MTPRLLDTFSNLSLVKKSHQPLRSDHNSDPPKQLPFFTAMDAVTASLVAAEVITTPSQAPAATAAPPQPGTEAQEVEKWPLLSLTDFTIHTITTIRNEETEDEARYTSMAERYVAYKDDYELVSTDPEPPILAGLRQLTQPR